MCVICLVAEIILDLENIAGRYIDVNAHPKFLRERWVKTRATHREVDKGEVYSQDKEVIQINVL